jgi:hypothetical protein
MLLLSAESLCLVDGKHNIVPPIIPEEQEFVHFNTLWCYLFYRLSEEEKDDKGIVQQSDTWRKERKLRVHYASIAHVVDMVNHFCGDDKHVLCADGQEHIHFKNIYIRCIYMYIQQSEHVYTCY